MIRYSDEARAELKFKSFQYEVERRDEQWIEVIMQVELAEETPQPMDVVDFSIVAICTHQGHPIQLVTMEEGCDSEYQLTYDEKEQINAFVRSEDVQKAILLAAAIVD